MVKLLRYSRDNKILGLRYYAKIEDAPIFDLTIQAIIKTDNQLMVLYDYRWQECTDTDRSKGAYMMFYQGGPIDNFTYVSDPVASTSAESKYNT